ncbi:MAG: hypothetical protein K9M03_01070 [Kiritimatiellales bacterium]|nr:hypothetical protein [Kiritimatiellales bacterium]
MFKLFKSRGDEDKDGDANPREHITKYLELVGKLDEEVVRVQDAKGNVDTDKGVLKVRDQVNELLGSLDSKKQHDIAKYWETEKIARTIAQSREEVRGKMAGRAQIPVRMLKVSRNPIQQCANQTVRLASGVVTGSVKGLVQGIIDPFRQAA